MRQWLDLIQVMHAIQFFEDTVGLSASPLCKCNPHWQPYTRQEQLGISRQLPADQDGRPRPHVFPSLHGADYKGCVMIASKTQTAHRSISHMAGNIKKGETYVQNVGKTMKDNHLWGIPWYASDLPRTQCYLTPRLLCSYSSIWKKPYGLDSTVKDFKYHMIKAVLHRTIYLSFSWDDCVLRNDKTGPGFHCTKIAAPDYGLQFRPADLHHQQDDYGFTISIHSQPFNQFFPLSCQAC